MALTAQPRHPRAVAIAERAGSTQGRRQKPISTSAKCAPGRESSPAARRAYALVRSSLHQVDAGTLLAIDFGTDLSLPRGLPAPSEALERVVEHAREAEAPGILSYALDQLAKLETRVADLTRAYALESGACSSRSRSETMSRLAASLAWLGLIEAMLGRAREPGPLPRRRSRSRTGTMTPTTSFARAGALGLEALGRGDAAAAVEWLEPAVTMLEAGGVATPELLPARRRPDRGANPARSARQAEPHLGRLDDQAQSDRKPLGPGRRRPLPGLPLTRRRTSGGIRDGSRVHDHEPSAFERARTELCYGERLRRVGERRARASSSGRRSRPSSRRSATVGRACPNRAARQRRAHPAARPHHRRAADAAGASDRPPRRRGTPTATSARASS